MSYPIFSSFLNLKTPVPLVHKQIDKHNSFTNVLLIDNQVKEFQTFIDSTNADTFPIVYSNLSSKSDLLALLQTNFTEIKRIGIIFTSNGANNTKMFLDRKPFFENKNENISENASFIINLIKEFQVKNIDFLACDTLNYSTWTNYYQLLRLETGVTIGASNDKTGNIKYGGDWIMESNSQDIELVYFTKSIEYYTFLLDNPIWSSGYDGDIGQMVFYNNYMYFPNLYTNTIIQTDLNGTIINNSWATSIQGLEYPECCVVYNDYLYVTNRSNNTISKISLVNPNTDYLAKWATSTQGLNTPIGMVINGNYLYVNNYSNNTTSKISLTSPNTDYIANWATSTQGLNGPVGMVINGNYLYVSNNTAISKISLTIPNTDYIANWATSTQGLNAPVCIVINGNYLYVSNFDNATISKISLTNPNTDYIANWATSTQGLNGPAGIAINGNYLYVSNFNNNTISQISLQYIPCFKEGTKILTDQGYKFVQDLKKGDLIKTLLHGFKPIVLIGKSEMYHSANFEERIKDQLYVCSQSQYPEILEDLVITGRHSILVDDFVSEEQKQKVIEVNGKIYGTDNNYRLPACADPRSSVFPDPGTYTIYHLALENNNYYMNYGIYANGLLVESCSKKYLKELSNMTLLD